jgi:hypothetical protein
VSSADTRWCPPRPEAAPPKRIFHFAPEKYAENYSNRAISALKTTILTAGQLANTPAGETRVAALAEPQQLVHCGKLDDETKITGLFSDPAQSSRPDEKALMA